MAIWCGAASASTLVASSPEVYASDSEATDYKDRGVCVEIGVFNRDEVEGAPVPATAPTKAEPSIESKCTAPAQAEPGSESDNVAPAPAPAPAEPRTEPKCANVPPNSPKLLSVDSQATEHKTYYELTVLAACKRLEFTHAFESAQAEVAKSKRAKVPATGPSSRWLRNTAVRNTRSSAKGK